MKLTDEEQRRMSEEYGYGPAGITKANIAASLTDTPPSPLETSCLADAGLARAAAEEFPQPKRKDGEEPCGECHIQPGETCDICGASRP